MSPYTKILPQNAQVNLDTQAAPAKSHSSSCSTHRHENMQMNAASEDVSESTFTIAIINYVSVLSKLRSAIQILTDHISLF